MNNQYILHQRVLHVLRSFWAAAILEDPSQTLAVGWCAVIVAGHATSNAEELRRVIAQQKIHVLDLSATVASRFIGSSRKSCVARSDHLFESVFCDHVPL